MNSKFNSEQIRAYASAFRKGDAIWCGGEWCEVVVNGEFERLSTKKDCSKNQFIVNGGEELEFEGAINGFIGSSLAQDRYRVTTLEHYKLQGGEKLVWLGDVEHFTFGTAYEVKHRPEYDVNVFVYDNDGYVRTPKSKNWAVIPKYEQVQSIERKEVKTSDIANILYKRYYDVLQSALHNNIKSALQENNYSLVIELSELAIEMEETK